MFCDKCRYRHTNEVCGHKKCSVYSCEKRHPRPCKYQRHYGRCKFKTYCSYSHEKQRDIFDNIDKIAQLEQKMKNFE